MAASADTTIEEMAKTFLRKMSSIQILIVKFMIEVTAEAAGAIKSPRVGASWFSPVGNP